MLMVKVTMNQFGLILRHIAFFLFPVPFLLGFAIEYRGHWTAYVAYAAIVVLVLLAVGRLVLEVASDSQRCGTRSCWVARHLRFHNSPPFGRWSPQIWN